MDIQNKLLENRNLAIWPRTGSVFIGVNQKGIHMRVAYFDNATISNDSE